MHVRRRVWIPLLIVGIVLVIFRLILPSILLRYVNKTLAGIPEYTAHVGGIDVSLWRGAYVIRNLKMIKKGGQEKFPFVDAPRIDLAIQWLALFEGKIVGVVSLTDPTLNFVQSDSKEANQLSAGGGWEEQGKKLFPFKINKLVIRNGKMTFRELGRPEQSDLHLTSMNLVFTGITNIGNGNNPLPSHINLQATVFDTGHLAVNGAAEVMKDPISFDVYTSVEEVDLTKINPYTAHHAGFTFKSGSFSLYSKLRSKQGDVRGYVKPLFTHIGIVNLKDASNPFELVWETIAATFVEIFTNHSKDQFATVIPLSGNLSDPSANLWATFVNMFRNAFIQAFGPGFDNQGTPPAH